LLLLVAAVLSLACTEHRVRAQDEDDPDEKPAPEPHRMLMEARLPAEKPGRDVLRSSYRLQYERWRSSRFQGGVQPEEQLVLILMSRVEELERSCRLSEEQVKKLTVAGKGDIKRFMDQMDLIGRTLNDSEAVESSLRNVCLEFSELDTALNAGLFGEKSLFSKTLIRTLDEAQSAAYERALIERNGVRYARAVSQAVGSIQSNLGLSIQQVEELTRLLIDDTRPPRRFGQASDIALALCQLSRLPEERTKPIFDDRQWDTLCRWMSVYKNGARGAHVLERYGFVFDDVQNIARPATAEPGTTEAKPRG